MGGGYGGCCCGVQLKKRGVPFVLVDPKEFFHHNIGAVRAAVFPQYCRRTAIPYVPTFGSSFVRGRVTSIDLDSRRATVEKAGEGAEVVVVPDFTHLVLATGSAGAFPARTEARTIPELEEESRRVAEEVRWQATA